MPGLISEADFRVEHNRLKKFINDKDKIRLIKVLGGQYTLTPHQAEELLRQVQDFGATITLCSELLPLSSDEDDFIHMALDLCKFPEDRVAMCAMLEVEFIPLVMKDKPKPKPRRVTVNSGLGGGHAYMS